jgi:hypothetical protein
LVLYQQFEDRILVPRVYGATLNLPPLVVLITVLIGAELLGVVGVLLSLPAAAAGRVVLDYMLERRMLGISLPAATEGEDVFAPDREHRPGSDPSSASSEEPPTEEASPAG